MKDIQKLIEYCLTSSEHKWKTAESLYTKKCYTDCLFFCHLALEFLFKARYVELKGEMFPMVHDLSFISKQMDIQLPKRLSDHLAIINTFNIAGRYDDYKFTFYKRATPAYTKKYFYISKDFMIWLKNYTPKDK